MTTGTSPVESFDIYLYNLSENFEKGRKKIKRLLAKKKIVHKSARKARVSLHHFATKSPLLTKPPRRSLAIG